MNEEPFLRPRLTGERFDGHAIPLEFLKDLAVLEEMVIEVAKWSYLRENRERKRVPRGFTEGIELRLTGVEEGSAVPVIYLHEETMLLIPSMVRTFLEKARDSIICAISAAELNTSITEHLPEKVLGYFDRFCRGLREGEAVEFHVPSRPEPAKLTRESRRRLVLASTVREYTEETAVRGLIPEADQDNMTFEIQMIDDDHKVKASMSAQHLETVLAAFIGYKQGRCVLLEGVGRFSRQGRLQGFESIEHVTYLDPLDVPARIDELRRLKDGWLDGKGLAPSSEGLDWMSGAFERHFPDDLPLPFVYPSAEGGLQLEWTLGANEISLEVDLSTRRGDWHCLNMQTNEDETCSLGLETEAAWTQIADKIRKMNGTPA